MGTQATKRPTLRRRATALAAGTLLVALMGVDLAHAVDPAPAGTSEPSVTLHRAMDGTHGASASVSITRQASATVTREVTVTARGVAWRKHVRETAVAADGRRATGRAVAKVVKRATATESATSTAWSEATASRSATCTGKQSAAAAERCARRRATRQARATADRLARRAAEAVASEQASTSAAHLARRSAKRAARTEHVSRDEKRKMLGKAKRRAYRLALAQLQN